MTWKLKETGVEIKRDWRGAAEPAHHPVLLTVQDA